MNGDVEAQVSLSVLLLLLTNAQNFYLELFNPRLLNPKLFNPKSRVEKSGVGQFMVEKSGVESFGVKKSVVEMSFKLIGRG